MDAFPSSKRRCPRYIVMDTQLIVGGAKRTCSLSPEDYIAGALMLYLDAINLFLYILQILNQLNGDQSRSREWCSTNAALLAAF
ncbi:hypothetical protein HPB51_008926 [Rhipicephalus microplus]|uniref:Uncharacterized protein n=1 Tax=Rhipicephalus microplus TaxID=6941 RepID=A0A9J6E906_RHIMP|nr:hypothetical protein HPB51_008926 [Rhipicephalus microplus]